MPSLPRLTCQLTRSLPHAAFSVPICLLTLLHLYYVPRRASAYVCWAWTLVDAPRDPALFYSIGGLQPRLHCSSWHMVSGFDFAMFRLSGDTDETDVCAGQSMAPSVEAKAALMVTCTAIFVLASVRCDALTGSRPGLPAAPGWLHAYLPVKQGPVHAAGTAEHIQPLRCAAQACRFSHPSAP